MSATATLDRFGRVVIPKSVRDAAGLQPGARLSVVHLDGRIELVPEQPEVRVERRGRLLVAVPEEDVPKLSADEVNELLRSLRER